MCQAANNGIVVQLAEKVVDGTRCRKDSLDMCIEGKCKVGNKSWNYLKFNNIDINITPKNCYPCDIPHFIFVFLACGM